MDEEECTRFKERTVDEFLRSEFNEKKTKVSSDALKLVSEATRIYVMEALTRCAEQAKKEDAQTVTLEHLEKILPQFLLDFN